MHHHPDVFPEAAVDLPAAAPPASDAEVISLLGADYSRQKTRDGGDLHLTGFGVPFREQLAPEDWFAPDWFAATRTRLLGTSTSYKVPTKPVRGVSLHLVVRFCRVGEEVPIDTLTRCKNINAEFGCLRADASTEIHTSRRT